ncbi:Chitin synthase, class 2, partial [Quaeritorhiza haematococci]
SGSRSGSTLGSSTGGLLGRSRTVKEVSLTSTGKFILDVPVSKHALQGAKYTQGPEFTHMRYTAVTCPANDFANNYSLRQIEYKRRTRVALVVTMYNEDDELFCKSMSAVFKNIAYMCSEVPNFSWGPNGWKEFVVVIVSDGRSKINERVLTVLGAMGCYADNLTKASINGDDVTAHIFEYTPQICVDRDLKIQTSDQGYVPVQVIFCLKEKNAKKINSHRWFFNGICKVLQPDMCFLLDVGTKPTMRSFYHLWLAFDRDPNVGGACGEIKAELGKGWVNLINPLVATQNFEYKMSNILDKPLESVFGYISVLPGAFSAYRYAALQGAPLDQYFKGETMHGGADVFKANMYLAEDRILCFEIVTKVGESWVLKYVKDAQAETDVPDALPELISQRRRWLNGSFFASVHAVSHFPLISRSGHSFGRKIMLYLEFFYNFINLLFSWFAVGNFYLAFYFLFDVSDGNVASEVSAAPALPSNGNGPARFLFARQTNNNGNNLPAPIVTNTPLVNPDDPFQGWGELVFQITRNIYLFLLIVTLVSALGNRPQGSKFIYTSMVIFFGLIMGLMLFLGGWTIFIAIGDYTEFRQTPNTTFWQYFSSTPAFRDVIISLGSTYGLYLISSIIHLDPWHCFTSMLQYMLLLPAYVNILMIYAFSNLHDVSWGTKGDNQASTGGDAVVAKKTADGAQVVQVEMPQEAKDVDAAWLAFSRQLDHNRANKPTNEQKRDAKTKTDDYFKLFRTRLVLLWILCNGVLIVVFTNQKLVAKMFPNRRAGNVNPYLTFLFWSVAGLSAVRFVFSMVYLVLWWVDKVRDATRAKGSPA